jgi:hypothetical protein
MDFKTCSAAFGLFQKSGAWVSCSSSEMSERFLSMSKIPPQSIQPDLDVPNIFL